MRTRLVTVCLLLAACAGNGGGQSAVRKVADEPILYERFGTVTTSDVADTQSCGVNHVSWCKGSRNRQKCECIHLREAKTRTRRLADQLARPMG